MLKDLGLCSRFVPPTHTQNVINCGWRNGVGVAKERSHFFPLSPLSFLFFAMTLGIIIAFGNCLVRGEIDFITKYTTYHFLPTASIHTK